MRPTTAFDDNVFDLNALLHSGTVFQPRDVLADPSLSVSEKRAILASWASDASAIASCPSLRSPAGLKAPVSIDEILNALCELDGMRCASSTAAPVIRPAANRTAFARRRELWPLRRRDAMDDVRLPRHVPNRFERRWAARFAQRRYLGDRRLRLPATIGSDRRRSGCCCKDLRGCRREIGLSGGRE